MNIVTIEGPNVVTSCQTLMPAPFFGEHEGSQFDSVYVFPGLISFYDHLVKVNKRLEIIESLEPKPRLPNFAEAVWILRNTDLFQDRVIYYSHGGSIIKSGNTIRHELKMRTLDDVTIGVVE